MRIVWNLIVVNYLDVVKGGSNISTQKAEAERQLFARGQEATAACDIGGVVAHYTSSHHRLPTVAENEWG